MDKYTIDIPIYFGELSFVKVKPANVEEVYKEFPYVKKEGIEEYRAIAVFGTNPQTNVDQYGIIFFEEPDMSIIAHETVHIAHEIFKNCGVQMTYDNDEHYAYLVGWIVSECEKFLKSSSLKI